MKKLLAIFAILMALTVPAYAAGEAEPVPTACAHHFEVSVVKEANCTEKGLLAYTCSECGLTYTAETLPNGQHLYEQDLVPATCTEDGSITYTCSLCGDSYTQTLEATGHKSDGVTASCTVSERCVQCGAVLTPATGHDYTYQYDATFDADGNFLTYGTWLCANCGESIPATAGNAEFYYRDGVPAEADGEETAPAEDTPAETAPTEEAPDEKADPPQAQPLPRHDGLWTVIAVIAAGALIAELVILVRLMSKRRPGGR